MCRIFGAAMKYLSSLGPAAKLRLYHEVTVARAADQFFEYRNCHTAPACSTRWPKPLAPPPEAVVPRVGCGPLPQTCGHSDRTRPPPWRRSHASPAIFADAAGGRTAL